MDDQPGSVLPDRPTYPPHRFCVAPMIDWSDRHCRYFWRLLTRNALLYTEMITSSALIHGDSERHLRHHPDEHPVALQLGGSDPGQLARCARWAEQHGYVEVNLNAGCPSSRVQSGRFGACLMGEAGLVADCIAAMREAVDIPVTIKHRIGIDNQDSFPELCRFVEAVAGGGCRTFIIHARKAWLQGLSPRQNREIPPLQYSMVYRVKDVFPELEIVVNGGIEKLTDCETHLTRVDGVMLGRAAYRQPWLLADVDSTLFQADPTDRKRAEVIHAMLPYIEEQLSDGARLHHLTRHMLGLFNGKPGARNFRRFLSENANRPGADGKVLLQALALVSEDIPPTPKAC